MKLKKQNMATSLEVLRLQNKEIKKSVFNLYMHESSPAGKNLVMDSSKKITSLSSVRDLNDAYPRPKFNYDQSPPPAVKN